MLFLQRSEVTRPRVQRFPSAGSQSHCDYTPAMAESSQDGAPSVHSSHNGFRGCCAADSATACGKRSSGVHSTLPVNHQDDFAGCRIDIGDDLVDQGSHDALFQACIGMAAPCQMASRSAAKFWNSSTAAGDLVANAVVCLLLETRFQLDALARNAWFQRRSSSSATMRLSGSTASNCF